MMCFNCGSHNITIIEEGKHEKYYCDKCGPLQPSEIEGLYFDD